MAYLAANGEETTAVGIHQNDLVFVSSVRSVWVDSENELALGIVDSEAIAGEEERSLENSEMGFFFEDIRILHNETLFHH